MLLSTLSILDLFRAGSTGFDHVDRVDHPQAGVPAVADDDRAAGVAAQPALEEADAGSSRRCFRKPLLLLAPELIEVPTSPVATTGASGPPPGSPGR
jgi:hypothetical protein